MNFIQAVKSAYSNYARFSGRSSRSEFWWFVLFYMIVSMVLTNIDIALFGTFETTDSGFQGQTNTPILSGLFGLATLIPSIAVSVRRLHDGDRSGWWYLLFLVPIIGFIVLVVWFAGKGTRGPNRFGQDPLGLAPYDDDDGDYSASSIPRVGN